MKRYFLLLLTLLCSAVWAEGTSRIVTFPPGCQLIPDIAMADGQMNIAARNNHAGPRLLVVKNTGKYDVCLIGVDDALTRVSVDHWAAKVFTEPTVTVRCIEIKPGSEQYVPCAQVVRACEYHDVMFWQEDMPTEWLVEDKNLYDLLAHVSAHGIQLPTILPGG